MTKTTCSAAIANCLMFGAALQIPLSVGIPLGMHRSVKATCTMKTGIPLGMHPLINPYSPRAPLGTQNI